MSADLTLDAQTIAQILSHLEDSIRELRMRRSDLAAIGNQAFGASPGGTRTHQHTNRAYEVVVDTLARMEAAHDDLSGSMLHVRDQIGDVDDQVRAAQHQHQERLDEVGGGVPA